MRSQLKKPKASPKKTFPSDPFLDGLNVVDFTQAPVSEPGPAVSTEHGIELSDIPGETRKGRFSIPYQDSANHHHLLCADTDNVNNALELLRTISRSNIGVWHICRQDGRDWKRARWLRVNAGFGLYTGLLYGGFVFRTERIEHGEIVFDSEITIDDSGDIGL